VSAVIAIRKCAPGDEEALALVGQASFLEAFAGTLDRDDIIAHCRRQHSAEKYRTWLNDDVTQIWAAEAGGAPIGYLVLTKPDLPLADVAASDLEIKRVYLLYRFQGTGTGRRLMDEARRHAERAGARRLLLGVYENNTTAIAFYERLGYVEVGTRPFVVGTNTYHDFILALRLRN
jgi:ribosomal protein S18 acetylase RimI-like enzyme